MFTGLQSTILGTLRSPLRRHVSVAASVAAHLALLAAIIINNGRIVDARPDWLARGDAEHNYKLTYFPPDDVEGNAAPEVDAAKLLYPVHPKPRRLALPKSHATQPDPSLANAETGDHDSHAGSPLGTMIEGPVAGHEFHIAYSVVAPNPPIDRAELPRDLVGDVVIVVTIDSQGNVVETKLVQAIGHGLDEKIEATLRRWHYQPATLDGTPVASRYEVHFHFPS